MKTTETSQNFPQPKRREDHRFPLSPDGLILPDTEKFPELKGWAKHPIDGWVQVSDPYDFEPGSENSDENEDENEPPIPVTEAEVKARSLADLFDEAAWHLDVGTFYSPEGTYIDSLGGEKLSHLSPEEEKQFTEDLVALCSPSSESFYHGRRIRLLNYLKSYLYDLIDGEKFREAEILSNALQAVSESPQSGYILAKRAEGIMSGVKKWKGKSEFGKNLEVFERYGNSFSGLNFLTTVSEISWIFSRVTMPTA